MANKNKTTKTNAQKLQEVIMTKTMNSIANVPEEATKPAKKAKAKPVKETKAAPKKEVKVKKTTKATSEDKVKYIYPEDIKTPLERKKFRAGFRAKTKSLEAKLAKAKEGTKEYKAIAKELKEHKACLKG